MGGGGNIDDGVLVTEVAGVKGATIWLWIFPDDDATNVSSLCSLTELSASLTDDSLLKRLCLF